jgi:membrane protease subunit HflC
MKALVWLTVAVGLMAASSGLFTVNETEYAILTQFGKPVGEPIREPGLHWKTPLIQEVNRLDKRFMEWDGAPVAIPTKDKTYIRVAMFARWRILDPKIYFVRLHDERSANIATRM